MTVQVRNKWGVIWRHFEFCTCYGRGLTWNTVYMQQAINQLKAEGYPIFEDDLKHLSPIRHEHINPYGKYEFNVEEEFNREGFRPVRSKTLFFSNYYWKAITD